MRRGDVGCRPVSRMHTLYMRCPGPWIACKYYGAGGAAGGDAAAGRSCCVSRDVTDACSITRYSPSTTVSPRDAVAWLVEAVWPCARLILRNAHQKRTPITKAITAPTTSATVRKKNPRSTNVMLASVTNTRASQWGFMQVVVVARAGCDVT